MEHGIGVGDGDGIGIKVNKLRLVFLPWLDMGHIVSMVEFAKRLLHFQSDSDHQLDIVILNMQPPAPRPNLSSYIASVVSSSTSISFRDLPAVDQVPDFLGDTPEAALTAFIDLHVPLVRSALRDLIAFTDGTPVRVAALVVDDFGTSMIDVANELGLRPYIYFTSGAGFLDLMFHASAIASNFPVLEDPHGEGFLSPQFQGQTVDLPGLATPFPLSSMPACMSNPADDSFSTFILHAGRYLQAKGILINTFSELEPEVVKALEDDLYLQPRHKLPLPPIFAVGPIVSVEPKNREPTTTSGDRHACLRWLDEQPARSVVFLCFGSMGSLPAAQTMEIAVGLEQSEQRFLWALRSPAAQPQDQQGITQSPKDADRLEELLPEGFLERTKAKGLVWPAFAPQKDILAHPAVGGFVTHCGWNSCLESLWHGVPMAAWPLYAEQHFNAFQMVREMGVALEVRIDRKAGNASTAEEVKRVVVALMGHEGANVRKKTEQMKDVARGVFHEGGSSFHALQRFVHDLLAAIE